MPMTLAVAPFPEGFHGDADEHAQQLVALMTAYVEGYLLTGLVLPAGSTLPTSNIGPVVIGNQWYFWDPVTNQYLPQSGVRVAKNYAKNCAYQIQQTGTAFTISATGQTSLFDMSQVRATVPNALSVALDVGPTATPDNDLIPGAIKYMVGPTLVASPAATDYFCHEHLIEGCDIQPLQGQLLAVSFSAWTNVPGTYSMYLQNASRDASFVATFTLPASAWTRVKIGGIPAMPTYGTSWNYGEGQTGLYIGITMAAGGNSQTTTLNAWQNANRKASSTSINMMTATTNQLKLTGIKLEGGSVPSYLTVPSFESDYHDAVRYYWTSFTYQSVTAGANLGWICHVAGLVMGTAIFPRRMCKPPTVVPYSPVTNTAGTVRNSTTAADVTIATLTATQKGIPPNFAVTGAAVGNGISANIIADARLS